MWLTLLVPAATCCRAEASYIHEFPHPEVVAHYHPRAGQSLQLRDIRYALEQGCHGIELDLHLRDGEVVCNHDGPEMFSPRLEDALRLIVRYMDRSPTVQRDGRQFFLVIEPKVNDPALFDATARVLERYADHFSTAAGPKDGPRGITVVVTGAHLNAFGARLGDHPPALDRLCLLENNDYTGRIASLAPGNARFQWTAIQYPRHRGRVEALHAGTDPALKGRYNIRVWGTTAATLDELLATGVDSINVDHEQVPGFVAQVRARAKETLHRPTPD